MFQYLVGCARGKSLNQLISGALQGLDNGVQMSGHDDEGKKLNVSLAAEPVQGLQDDLRVSWVGEDGLPTGYGAGDEVEMVFVEEGFVFHGGLSNECTGRGRPFVANKCDPMMSSPSERGGDTPL